MDKWKTFYYLFKSAQDRNMHSHVLAWEEYIGYKLRGERSHRFFPIHSILKACKSQMSYCSQFERLQGYKRLLLILSSGINVKLVLSQVICYCNAVLFLYSMCTAFLSLSVPAQNSPLCSLEILVFDSDLSKSIWLRNILASCCSIPWAGP